MAAFPNRFSLPGAGIMPYGAVTMVSVAPQPTFFVPAGGIVTTAGPRGMMNPNQRRPPMPAEKPPVTTCFVGNIHEKCSNDLIRAMLQECGNVVGWKRIQGSSGKFQAFGFCEFDHPESTLRALRIVHGWSLGDKKLVVKVDDKCRQLLRGFVNKKRELDGKSPLKLDGDELPSGPELTVTDPQFRQAIEKLVKEQAPELLAAEEGEISNRSPTLHGKGGNLDVESLDREKKEYIAREINAFRETHKEDEKKKDDNQQKSERDRPRRRQRTPPSRQRSHTPPDAPKDKDTKEKEKEKRPPSPEKDRPPSRSSVVSADRRSERSDYRRQDKDSSRSRHDRDRDRDRDRGDRDRDRERDRRSASRRRDRDARRRPGTPPPPPSSEDEGEARSDRSRSSSGARSESSRGSRRRGRSRRHRDTSRSLSRSRSRAPDSEDEEEYRERRKLEKKLEEKERAYQERLKKWELRERRRAKDYEKERTRKKQSKKDEQREAKKLKEFLEDYEDERDDVKFYRGSALFQRRREYEKERESDTRDRQKEREELEEIKRRLTDAGHENPDIEAKRIQLEQEEALLKRLRADSSEPPSPKRPPGVAPDALQAVVNGAEEGSSGSSNEDDSGSSSSESGSESGSDASGASPAPGEKRKRRTVGVSNEKRKKAEGMVTETAMETQAQIEAQAQSSRLGFAGLRLGSGISHSSLAAFADDDDVDVAAGTGLPKKPFMPLELSAEEKAAAMTPEEKKKLIKSVIEAIPTEKSKLFAYPIAWQYVDDSLIERRVKPWVNKKIMEYIGEEEKSLVDFICGKVKEKGTPAMILQDIGMVLDDEAEVFVVKMWRLLIYEIEAKKLGLVKADGSS